MKLKNKLSRIFHEIRILNFLQKIVKRFFFSGYDHAWIHFNSKFEIKPKRCDFHWCHCHLGIVGNIFDCGDDDLPTSYQQPLGFERFVRFT